MHPSLPAKYLCDRQPQPIRKRLIEDAGFRARMGLSGVTIIGVGDVASINRAELFATARRVLAEATAQELRDGEGRRIAVEMDEDGLVLKRATDAEQSVAARVSELLVLSPRRDERIRILEDLLNRLGPATPDFATLQEAAEDRELTDEEVAALFDELMNGVASVQARMAAILPHASSIRVDDLVPPSLGYFERFCGPDPRDSDPETYLTHTLPTYRRDLLRRDLVQGLDICLLGTLRSDLSPADWIKHVSDDALWAAIDAVNPLTNPFALLGALDIAVVRQHDERFLSFADRAVAKLIGSEFNRPDGLDTYEVLPLFAELVADQMSMLEGGTLRAPYWRRMCAWMQAGYVERLTGPMKLNIERLRQWIRGHRSPAAIYASLVDLRREPMHRATEFSPKSLRSEVVGRLAELRARHGGAGRQMPRSGEIDQAIARLADEGLPLAWAMPGPLEGHRRPAEVAGRSLPDADAEEFVRQLQEEPGGPIWSVLAYSAQYFSLSEELLARACSACTRLGELFHEGGDERLGRLADGCLAAAAMRDTQLAGAICRAVITYAQNARSEQVSEIITVVLLAGAAHSDEQNWIEWVEAQLVELAARLPAGSPSKTLFEHLQELKKVTPLGFRLHSRAEAYASCAS